MFSKKATVAFAIAVENLFGILNPIQHQLAKTSLCNGACTVGTKKARLQTERVQHNGSLQVQMKTSTMRLFLQRSRREIRKFSSLHLCPGCDNILTFSGRCLSL